MNTGFLVLAVVLNLFGLVFAIGGTAVRQGVFLIFAGILFVGGGLSVVQWQKTEGNVGIERAIDRDKIYVLMGTPIDSLAKPGYKVITVHSAGDGDQSFAVATFPPTGFEEVKFNDGRHFLAPAGKQLVVGSPAKTEFVPPKK